MSLSEPLSALNAPTCPLCGQPNGCAVAQSGSLDTPCWCRDVTFTPDTLGRIPAAQLRRACICQTCAQHDRPETP